MKDRTILSALHDGEIHSPFREACEKTVSTSPELQEEMGKLKTLSGILAGAYEPDFEQGKSRAFKALMGKIEAESFLPRKPRGLLMTWPWAAAAAFVLSFGALLAGYGIRSAGFEISLGSQETIKKADYLSQEIRVEVPKKFTLPTNPEGQMLLSSFEGGQ